MHSPSTVIRPENMLATPSCARHPRSRAWPPGVDRQVGGGRPCLEQGGVQARAFALVVLDLVAEAGDRVRGGEGERAVLGDQADAGGLAAADGLHGGRRDPAQGCVDVVGGLDLPGQIGELDDEGVHGVVAETTSYAVMVTSCPEWGNVGPVTDG